MSYNKRYKTVYNDNKHFLIHENVCCHYISSYIMKNKYCYYTSSRITKMFVVIIHLLV